MTDRNRRNTSPDDIFDCLLRLRNCNKQQLSEALGIHPSTLRTWMRGDIPSQGLKLLSALLISTLRTAEGADTLAQWHIELNRISKYERKT